MFIDASAVVAILDAEENHEVLIDRLERSRTRRSFSPLVRYEASVSLARRKSLARSLPKLDSRIVEHAVELVQDLFTDLGVSEITISPAIGLAAIAASVRYGKVAGHPAALNFGDCFSYACAKSLGVPLLYKGDDFAKTDLA